MSAYNAHQTQAAKFLVRNGAGLALAGVVWPFAMIAGVVKYPRLALGAHMQFMATGTMSIAIGVAVLPTLGLVRLSPLQCNVLKVALAWNWIAIGSEALGSFWGTKEILPIAAGQAGALGGTKLQELFVSFAHVGAVPVMVAAMAFLTWELL